MILFSYDGDVKVVSLDPRILVKAVNCFIFCLPREVVIRSVDMTKGCVIFNLCGHGEHKLQFADAFYNHLVDIVKYNNIAISRCDLIEKERV